MNVLGYYEVAQQEIGSKSNGKQHFIHTYCNKIVELLLNLLNLSSSYDSISGLG